MTFCKIAGELQINTAWKSLPENRLGEFEWYPNYRNISIKDQHRMKIAWTNFMRDFFHPTWKSLERIWVVSHLPKVSITDQPRMNIAWANFMRDFFRTTWKTLERICVVSHVPEIEGGPSYHSRYVITFKLFVSKNYEKKDRIILDKRIAKR